MSDIGHAQTVDICGRAGLKELDLSGNELTALPEGAFAGLTRLRRLRLQDNHLVGLSRDGSLFAGLPDGVGVELSGQTEAR